LPKPYKLLIAPLDWGLGHATRVIPLIKCLLTESCEIIIASEGEISQLLQKEFPELTFLPLKGYKIKYTNKKKWLPLKIILQSPAILLSILQEHQWLKNVVKKYSINAVISDNRFGLYHSKIPSVYITHQVLIKTGNGFSGNIATKLHYGVIKKYSKCWVPDFVGPTNIAGELSHPPKVPNNIEYIGCFSRFEKIETPGSKYDVLVLLSGPEPQRTIFENLLLSQLNRFNGEVLFVRGMPAAPKNSLIQHATATNIRIENHLSAAELSFAIQQAKIVICRSGYSTVMDLIKLQKKAIMVPTPGQPEQEYLAEYLYQQELFYSTKQEDFSLERDLEKAFNFPFLCRSYDMEQYKKVVHQFVDGLAKNY
jgi:uncharacterized protein (TIGR00661 family)